MLELRPDNLAAYLEKAWGLKEVLAIEPLGWGVSNAVFRVRTATELLVVKQSRGQLRTKDAWYSDLDRVYREQEVMELLGPLVPASVVPKVLFSDRVNYVFAMSHAPLVARVWKEILLEGEVDPQLGHQAGKILGRIHEATSGLSEMLRFSDHRVFVQLRVDPFYRRIQERCPDIASAVEPLIEDLLTRREALCHGDYSPKNLLAHEGAFTLVDYETAHWGDPTMDLGFFLSHLMLKATRAVEQRPLFWELIRAFWRGYDNEVRFRPHGDLTARAIGHCGLCMLARIDGTSPVDYLPDQLQKEFVRRFGRRLLRERPATWNEVTDIFENT